MNDAAGLNDSSVFDVVMGILYGITAIVLIVTSYIILTRKYRLRKLEAINQLEFITSRYNVYDNDTQFLFNVPKKAHIKLELIDENENLVKVLVDAVFNEGEHIYEFKTKEYPTGLYYLKLHSDNVDMLRKIKINNN